jgi:ribosomal protection tetracycline resistance protein
VQWLNLGILAHVDAGKTSLTERLLLSAGVIDELGSVDAGSTQTDTLALERRRGITIKSAVATFTVGATTINLIDTPGHPDFIAEVERVLGVLDGAVLVVSGVEGVQPQTRVLLRTLRRLRIPTVVFVNKLDRAGADFARTIDALAKLAPVTPAHEPALDVLAEHDDAVLSAWVDGETIDLRALAREARAHPAFGGSAITGAGVDALIDGLTTFLPAAGGDPGAPLDGTVFKVERGVAYARIRSGTLRVRDALPAGRVTRLEPGPLGPGMIGRVHGAKLRVGDPLGEGARGGHHFPPPTLAAIVEPVRADQGHALHLALSELAEQDPLINLRGDAVSLYGEVQKEVIEATLLEEYGIAVTFRETTTICIERPCGIGAAVELIGENPFLATVGLRVEPGEGFHLEVELGSMPFAFFKAVEETVRETLQRGNHGWEVRDARVTMTHSGYYARQSHSHGTFDKSMSSTAGDFRALTPIVLRRALQRAGTTVYEPLHSFRLEAPPDTLPGLLPALGRLRATPLRIGKVVEGEIPAAQIHALERVLPELTRGEGGLETAFARYVATARGSSASSSSCR